MKIDRPSQPMEHSLAFAARLCLILALAATCLTAGCGKKNDPVLPNGQTDHFPGQYPSSAEPQQGVFN